MLTDEQNQKIEELAKKYAPLKAGFPKWDPDCAQTHFFPDQGDLKVMAGKVEPFAYTQPKDRELTNPKLLLKYLFVRFLQPLLRILSRRQMLFNEFTWLLANTVSAQNRKIMELEQRLNDLQVKNPH